MLDSLHSPFFRISRIDFIGWPGQLVAMTVVASVCNAQQGGVSSFDRWDRNQDGFVTKEEFPSRLPARNFERADSNRDGRISRKEDAEYLARLRGSRRPQTTVPEGTKIERDIIYETVGKRKLSLDLYRPARSVKRTPIVIWIHGGGWRSGSKDGPNPALDLLRRGYAVASVEYRLSSEAVFPAALEDCKAAVSFLRLNADKYNLAKDKFGVWGSSAGGHLVALLGTTSDVDDFDSHPVTRQASSAVQAVCDWFGPTDFLRMNDFESRIDHDAPDSPESRFIGGPIQENQEKTRRANPVSYASKSDPPFLIQHGDQDPLVPCNQSELLHKALRKAGVNSTLHLVKGAGHRLDESEKQRSMDFFDRVFGNSK